MPATLESRFATALILGQKYIDNHIRLQAIETEQTLLIAPEATFKTPEEIAPYKQAFNTYNKQFDALFQEQLQLKNWQIEQGSPKGALYNLLDGESEADDPDEHPMSIVYKNFKLGFMDGELMIQPTEIPY